MYENRTVYQYTNNLLSVWCYIANWVCKVVEEQMERNHEQSKVVVSFLEYQNEVEHLAQLALDYDNPIVKKN